MCVCVCCFVCYYLNKPTFTFQTASDAQDINEAGLNSQHLQTLLYIEAKDANTVPCVCVCVRVGGWVGSGCARPRVFVRCYLRRVIICVKYKLLR